MSMLAPVKIDGFGVRRNASDTEVANTENRKKFVRMFASEAIDKGQAVAFDCNTTEPSTGGYGNTVVPSLVGGASSQFAIGIATEATPTGYDFANPDPIIMVQVEGICTIASIDDTNDDPGDMLAAGAGEGLLTITTAVQMPTAVLMAEGSTGDGGNATIYLINPANL